MSHWGSWSACSATCGGGQQYRHRTITNHAKKGGDGCQGVELSQTRGCSEKACEKQVDCVWGEWSEFGACTATCGGGMHTRDRHVAVSPRNGGKPCEPLIKQEVRTCNEQKCGINSVVEFSTDHMQGPSQDSTTILGSRSTECDAGG